MLSRRLTVVGLAALTACTPKALPKPLQSGESRGVALPDGGTAWLTCFDITTTAIDQIAWKDNQGTPLKGLYVPDSLSPAFSRLEAPYEGYAGSLYKIEFGDDILAFINAIFFERYDQATELSFPFKRDGVIQTGGSSPYGPIETPKDPRYKAVVLQALVWNRTEILVRPYDHKTGGILNDARYPDGLVTYDWHDHPANVLAGDPVGRYQLLGTGGPTSNLLYVLTITKGKMVQGETVLKEAGVTSKVLTLDGGPSTMLWTKAKGEIYPAESKALPHYLAFRRA